MGLTSEDVLLIRHPQTVAAHGVCYGALDLDPAPERLASDAARLAPLIPGGVRVIASPRRRARMLAERLGPPVETDDRLAELDFGRWEGLRWDDLPRAEIDSWAADPLGYRPGGGESVGEMAARTLDWWETLARDGRPVVAVGHGGPWRLLAAHAVGAPLANERRFPHRLGRARADPAHAARPGDRRLEPDVRPCGARRARPASSPAILPHARTPEPVTPPPPSSAPASSTSA